jgi:hypothetical protein
MRASQIAVTGLVVVAVSLVVFWLASYDSSEFRGSAPMRDSGVFTYYRYHAPLGDIPLATAGTYILRFSGLPSEHMALQFYVIGGSTANRHSLEDLSTELSVEIADTHGNILCSARATPAGTAPDRWTLMSSDFDAAYWHEHCRSIPFRRRTEYVLTVAIRNVDPRSPQFSLTATLEGGGIELS